MRPLLIDTSVGSRELERPLKKAGCLVRLEKLEYAYQHRMISPDFIIPINGPTGEMQIAIERKRVDEMVGAITDTRYKTRQLPGLLHHFPICWTLIEGRYWQGREGELMVNGREAGFTRQRVLYDTFEHFLTTLEMHVTLQSRGRMRFKRTNDLAETVSFLAQFYRWGQKDWSKHSGMRGVDETEALTVGFEEQSFKRSVAAQLPGVYHTRSKAAAESFKSILHMMVAGEHRWRRVPGIGPKTARRIVRTIRERD